MWKGMQTRLGMSSRKVRQQMTLSQRMPCHVAQPSRPYAGARKSLQDSFFLCLTCGASLLVAVIMATSLPPFIHTIQRSST